MAGRLDGSGYGLSHPNQGPIIEAPRLDYLPHLHRSSKARIALVGCGGISEYHLRAYRDLGLEVVVLCDANPEKAEARRAEFYPDARVCTDYREALTDDVDVVDAATHADVRVPIIADALRSGKHVLSQKPFVTDLEVGQRLIKQADEANLRLAVNQNGRWAPHFAYVRAALRDGIGGEVGYLNFALEWDHSWTAELEFDQTRHLILFDFGIHWFDMCTAVFAGQEASQVSAAIAEVPAQRNRVPMAAHVLVEYPRGQATLSFNGAVTQGQRDATTVCGSKGTIRSMGPSLSEQELALYTEAGIACPSLEGTWFSNGFKGSMCELLNAISEDRSPEHAARGNMATLSLCFAAMASADDGGKPKRVGEITRVDY